MSTRIALCASLVALGLASSVQANLLQNPNFDTTTPLNAYNLVNMSTTLNSTALIGGSGGWTITSGAVDVVPNTYWQTAPGCAYSVDMIGTPGLGTLAQSVATAATVGYTLTFDMSVNPGAGPWGETGTTKILQIQALAANGTTVLASQTYQMTDGTRTIGNMQWASEVFSFTATGATSTLVVSALTPLNLPAGANASNIYCGPVIDSFNLFAGGSPSPSPEPASLSLLGVSVSALLLKRRRGR